jgi:hypothetical protein
VLDGIAGPVPSYRRSSPAPLGPVVKPVGVGVASPVPLLGGKDTPTVIELSETNPVSFLRLIPQVPSKKDLVSNQRIAVIASFHPALCP